MKIVIVFKFVAKFILLNGYIGDKLCCYCCRYFCHHFLYYKLSKLENVITVFLFILSSSVIFRYHKISVDTTVYSLSFENGNRK